MRKFLILAVLLLSIGLVAQTAAISGYCVQGSTVAKTQGLNSSNYLQGIIPSCSVKVYLTGTTNLATIYADSLGTELGNPFTATTKGQFLFYAATGQSYDVVLNGGISPNTYSSPVTITGIPLSNISGGLPFGCTSSGTENITCSTFNASLTSTSGVTGVPVASPTTAPTVTQSSTGGTVAAGNYCFEYTYQGANNGETTASPSSCVTTTGSTSTINVSAGSPLGAQFYYIYSQTNGAGSFTLYPQTGTQGYIGWVAILTTTPTTSGRTPPTTNTATQGINAIHISDSRTLTQMVGAPSLLVDDGATSYAQGPAALVVNRTYTGTGAQGVAGVVSNVYLSGTDSGIAINPKTAINPTINLNGYTSSATSGIISADEHDCQITGGINLIPSPTGALAGTPLWRCFNLNWFAPINGTATINSDIAGLYIQRPYTFGGSFTFTGNALPLFVDWAGPMNTATPAKNYAGYFNGQTLVNGDGMAAYPTIPTFIVSGAQTGGSSRTGDMIQSVDTANGNAPNWGVQAGGRMYANNGAGFGSTGQASFDAVGTFLEGSPATFLNSLSVNNNSLSVNNTAPGTVYAALSVNHVAPATPQNMWQVDTNGDQAEFGAFDLYNNLTLHDGYLILKNNIGTNTISADPNTGNIGSSGTYSGGVAAGTLTSASTTSLGTTGAVVVTLGNSAGSVAVNAPAQFNYVSTFIPSSGSAVAIVPSDNLSTTKGLYGANHANSGFVWWVNDDGSALFTNLTDSGLTPGNCVQAGTGGLLTTTAGPCSGSNPAFSAITGGTNTTAAMVVGTGASLGTSGTGTITATAVPYSGITGTVPTWNQNTTGTAANLSGTPALPNGTTATTQTAGDNSTKLATTAYADTKLPLAGGTLTGTLASSVAVAASSPVFYSTGALYTGGTGTTTFPLLFHQPTGASAATTWSSGANGGTIYGANEASGFTGNFTDFRINGVAQFTVGYNGGITNNGGSICITSGSAYCTFAASSQLGVGTNGGQSLTVGNGTFNAKAVTSSTIPALYVAAAGSITNQDSSGPLHAGTYFTNTNCAVNSTSPAACGSAAAGAVVVPTLTTTYTINTTAVTAHSRILLMPMTFAGDLPSSPTCVAPAITSAASVSAISAGTSFTIALTSTTGQTCWQYWIVN